MKKIIDYFDAVEISNFIGEKFLFEKYPIILTYVDSKDDINRVSEEFFFHRYKSEEEEDKFESNDDLKQVDVNVNGVIFRYVLKDEEDNK